VPCAREQPFVCELLRAADPGRPALLEHDRQLTYAELADAVNERASQLGLREREIVLLTGTNSIEYVVSYLALLSAGHVPLLAGSHVARMAAAWRPAATVRADATGVAVEPGATQSRQLHPDLALLLSTSGSTGSPKLVRLSDHNLSSNARAIGSYLELTPDDCGITSLPLHYCYGLSVLHSHLAAGASVVLTDASVVDPCFTDALQAQRVTNMAGVPHTFELLERAGPDRLHVPTLRFLTQAGGRMAPERVEEWVDRAERWDAKFFAMYGQTEATARMAYLPPEIARRRPSAIGRPIPGGCLELRPVEGLPDGVGELVYRGPNVMLGYATADADLAMGATLAELPTGDIGRFHADDGVFEFVGRRSRFVKPFGVRVDLDLRSRSSAARAKKSPSAATTSASSSSHPGRRGPS
jgi:acyl-CoA synthetase (AMP-forming)/AMP-acid ligase II